MAPIDSALLHDIARGGDAGLLAALAGPLAAQLVPANGFTSALRCAHFLAQCAYETAYFTRLQENLDYMHADVIARTFPVLGPRAASLVHNPEALANAAYAGKWGNGDEAGGDGWRYRGRGLLDHTFRDNYAELASALDAPLLRQPDLLLEPDCAVRAGIAFFRSRNCLERADADETAGITRAINGDTSGLADRAILKRRALQILS